MTGERIWIDGGATGLVLGVDDEGRLHQLALGGPDAVGADTAFPTALYPLAYPTFGEEALREPALRVTQADGAIGTRLVFSSAAQSTHPGGVVHRVELVDRVAPLQVTLCWRTWPAYDLIEQWVEVTNTGDAPCTLHQAASAAPALPGDDPWFTHWGGGWANEWTETTEPVGPGTKTVASAGGVRSSLHRPPISLFAPKGRATETEGSVLLTTIVWGGDTRFDVEMAMHRHCRLIAGIQHRGAERTLDPGDTFTTPPAILRLVRCRNRTHQPSAPPVRTSRGGARRAPPACHRVQQLGGAGLRPRHGFRSRSDRRCRGGRGRTVPARRRLVRIRPTLVTTTRRGSATGWSMPPSSPTASAR